MEASPPGTGLITCIPLSQRGYLPPPPAGVASRTPQVWERGEPFVAGWGGGGGGGGGLFIGLTEYH